MTRHGFFGDPDVLEVLEPHARPEPVAAASVTGPVPVLVPRPAVWVRVAHAGAWVTGLGCVFLFGVALHVIGGAS
jgi:hypothetical protein